PACYGSAWVWGSNSSGVFGNGGNTGSSAIPVQALTGVIATSDGAHHIMALLNSSQVDDWGSEQTGELGFGGLDQPDYKPIPAGLIGFPNQQVLGGAVATAAG